MSALTGVTPDEFSKLLPLFVKEWNQTKEDKYLKDIKHRQRKPGGGTKGFLKTIEDKLFYILFYYKCYSTFDLLSFFFNCNRSNACRRMHQLTLIIESVLDKKMVLPKRKIESVDEFFKIFPEAKDIFIDGTERPIQRSADNDTQKQNYSGKKKKHTKKNIVVTDEYKKIGLLGATTNGKEHDLPILKKDKFLEHVPDDIPIHFDLGFQGIATDFPNINSILPKKKPKGKELTEDDKEQNTAKSRIRILVENAIGGVKRLRIVSDVLRNRKIGFVDTAMLVACGIWNFHLAQAV